MHVKYGNKKLTGWGRFLVSRTSILMHSLLFTFQRHLS